MVQRMRGRRQPTAILAAILVAATAMSAWARAGQVAGHRTTPSRPQPPTLGALCNTAASSMAVGPDGSLFVDEGGFGQQGGVSGDMILHFSAAGRFLGSVGPTDTNVATDRRGDLYYVLHRQLKKQTAAGTLLLQWPIGDLPNSDPTLIAVDPRGEVFVAQDVASQTMPMASRISRYGSTGRLLGSWVTPHGIRSMAADDAGSLFITDVDVLKLDAATGSVLAQPSDASLVATDPNGTLYLGNAYSGDGVNPWAVQRAPGRGHTRSFTTLNRSDAQAGALAIDRRGTVYIARDAYGVEGVDKISPTGILLASCPHLF